RRISGRTPQADLRDHGFLRAADGCGRRLGTRRADRRPGLLAAGSVGGRPDPGDSVDGVVHTAPLVGRTVARMGRCRRIGLFRRARRCQGAGVRSRASAGYGAGRHYWLRRRHHPRHYRWGAFGPYAARTLRHCRRACRHALYARGDGRVAPWHHWRGRRAGRLCAARRGDDLAHRIARLFARAEEVLKPALPAGLVSVAPEISLDRSAHAALLRADPRISRVIPLVVVDLLGRRGPITVSAQVHVSDPAIVTDRAGPERAVLEFA